jgi:hypothetical protein
MGDQQNRSPIQVLIKGLKEMGLCWRSVNPKASTSGRWIDAANPSRSGGIVSLKVNAFALE